MNAKSLRGDALDLILEAILAAVSENGASPSFTCKRVATLVVLGADDGLFAGADGLSAGNDAAERTGAGLSRFVAESEYDVSDSPLGYECIRRGVCGASIS